MRHAMKNISLLNPLFICMVIFLFASCPAQARTLSDFTLAPDLQNILTASENIEVTRRAQMLKEMLEQYTSDAPEDPLGHFFLGNACAELEAYPESLGHFGDALALAPDLAEAHAQSAMALYFVSQMYEGQGEESLHLARRAVEKAVSLDPERADFHSLAATIYLAGGDNRAARGALQRVLRRIPGAVNDRLRLSALYVQLGHYQKARDEFWLSYILSSPGNQYAMVPREDIYDLYNDQTREALNNLNQAADLIAQADTYIAQRRFKDAEELLAEARDLAPNEAEVQYALGRFEQDVNNDYEAAQEHFAAAAAEEPLFLEARRALCLLIPYMSRVQSEQDDAGNIEYEPEDDAEPREPEEPDPLTEEEKREFDAQINACLEKITELSVLADIKRNLWTNPDDTESLMTLARGLLSEERWDDALPYLSAVLALEPDNQEAARSLECARDMACPPPDHDGE